MMAGTVEETDFHGTWKVSQGLKGLAIQSKQKLGQISRSAYIPFPLTSGKYNVSSIILSITFKRNVNMIKFG